MKSLSVQMPWPPSANRYWRKFRGRMVVSGEARKYIDEISILALSWQVKTFRTRLSLRIIAYPPDKRVRDIDNILKIAIDSLQHAGIYENDGQIDRIYIERGLSHPPGYIDIHIEEIN
jgi:crossover junction endodeoxyribonuclease RusA